MKDTSGKIKCLNCEKEFDSSFNFCPHCGQKNTDPDLKLKHIVSEYFASNFNIDSKFFATFISLLLHPAELTKEILAGKREKYLTPVRLYLLVSLVYFFTFSIGAERHTGIVTFGQSDSTSVDSLSALVAIDNIDEVNIDSLTTSEKFIYGNLKNLDSPEGQLKLHQKLKKNLSLGMFILIPLTAFIFYILFRKRTKYYIPNLIFTFHLQSLFFLWFSIFTILDLIADYPIVKITEGIFIIVLLYKWVKAFYETSTAKTIFKLILFSMSYFVLLIIFLGAVLGVSILF